MDLNDTLIEPNRHVQCIPFNNSRICIQGHIELSPGEITHVYKTCIANLRKAEITPNIFFQPQQSESRN